jgi:hypothetical protein
MKKLLAAIVGLGLVLSVASPASANLDAFLSQMVMDKESTLILTSEYGRDGNHSQLSIQPGAVEEGGKRAEWIQCASMQDAKCTTKEALKRITANSILADCSLTNEDTCIESLSFGSATGDLVRAIYTGEVSRDTDFPADAKSGLLAGHGLPLYENTSSVPVSTTTKFAVLVRPEAFWDFSTNKFRIERMEAKVIPYQLKPRGTVTLGCSFILGDQCAEIVDFAPDTRVELKFRIPNAVGGWFSGRMKAPNISVNKYNAKVNNLTISAEPVEVAALGLVKKTSEFTAKEKMWNENHGGWSTGGGKATGANSWQPDVFPFIENYRKQVNDTSIGTNRVWNFMTIGGGGGSNCLADKSKVLGIVTTNALGYAGESPEFKGGFLDYKVAGLHYLPGGEELVYGTYDLVMRSETARCLYGFGKAPLYASVSVINEKGAKSTATTVVAEKNGWLKMAAYGFTFSKKTIKVKITKKKK